MITKAYKILPPSTHTNNTHPNTHLWKIWPNNKGPWVKSGKFELCLYNTNMTLQFDQDWKTTQQYHRRSGCFMESASDSLSSLINSINLFVVKSLEREPARVSSIKRCSGLHWNDSLTISELERVLRFYKKMSYWLYFVIPEKKKQKKMSYLVHM